MKHQLVCTADMSAPLVVRSRWEKQFSSDVSLEFAFDASECRVPNIQIHSPGSVAKNRGMARVAGLLSARKSQCPLRGQSPYDPSAVDIDAATACGCCDSL